VLHRHHGRLRPRSKPVLGHAEVAPQPTATLDLRVGLTGEFVLDPLLDLVRLRFADGLDEV
jgi:hypothetical protein